MACAETPLRLTKTTLLTPQAHAVCGVFIYLTKNPEKNILLNKRSDWLAARGVAIIIKSRQSIH